MRKGFSFAGSFLWIALVVVLALFVFGAIFYFSGSRTESGLKEGTGQGSESGQGTGAGEGKSFVDRLRDFFGGGGGVTGSVSSESDSSSPASRDAAGATNCAERQISYSIKNFTKTSECSELNEDVCVDKTVACSADVENLDSEAGGLFKINVNFFISESGALSEIKTITKEKTISAGATENFGDTIRLQSEGADGEANKNVGCSFTTSQVPKKSVC